MQEKNKTSIQKYLEQQFQELNENITLPEDLKKEVFNTIDMLRLFGDITDLFTSKFTSTEAELIDFIVDEKNIDRESTSENSLRA